MIAYPETDHEFDEAFRTEENCMEYLISVRWPDGPRCPACHHDRLWRTSQGHVLECSACGHKMRPLSGTIFQDSHISARLWLKVVWHVMSQKYGANAIGLGRVLGMALPTTWNILHKLRRVMVRSDREKLGPAVEIDESYVGGHEEGKPGRGADAKALVILAVELSSEKNRVGRIRLAKIPDASSSSLIPFIRQNVEPGSTVISDGWSGYHPVQDNGFGHIVKVMAQGKELPHVHVVFSLLKRWLPGTFQGGTSQKYLEFYMDEFVFRFNRRKSRSRGKLFGRLMEQAVATPPITRKELKVDKEPESIPQLFDG